MEEAADEMVDMEVVKDRAIHYAEERGIIFIDEIDKIAGRTGSSGGPDVSREGVQRDILPIVEGATVKTKYGQVKTDHILSWQPALSMYLNQATSFRSSGPFPHPCGTVQPDQGGSP